MFYTDTFLFLHLTKTGGTFFRDAVRTALTRNRLDLLIHRIGFNKVIPRHLSLRFPLYPYRYRELGGHHSFYRSVPPELRRLHVVTIVRDPVTWMLSKYRYGVWRSDEGMGSLPAGLENPPDEFDWFVRRRSEIGRFVQAGANQGRVGDISGEFISCLLDPEDREKVFAAFPDISGMVDVMRSVLPPITFLHQERLSEELARFLRSMGYPSDVWRRIPGHERKNVTRAREFEVRQDTEDLIRAREAFLYTFFPEYR